MDIDQLKTLAKDVKQWGNCGQAWPDPLEDGLCAVVGHIDEDGNVYPVATINCDQYDAARDSLKLARFYAAANPAAILELIERVEEVKRVRETEALEQLYVALNSPIKA